MYNEITKINLLKECNNDKQYCKFYKAYFKLYNEEKTKYKKGFFIFQIDGLDVLEYYEKDEWTKKEWDAYKKEVAFATIENYKFNNTKGLQEFCNNTIKKYYN